jgi:hypothetical protein
MTATATIVSTATVDHSEKRPMVVAISAPRFNEAPDTHQYLELPEKLQTPRQS